MFFDGCPSREPINYPAPVGPLARSALRETLPADPNPMSQLTGNLLVGQSGGPTAVINASVCGVVQEAFKHSCIQGIYGGMNGILGMLNEEIFDFRKEAPATIEGLKHTPAAGLGTCRYKLDFKKKAEKAAQDMDRLFQVFQAHNIRFFFYAGGND